MIMERFKCMLSHDKLSKLYWADTLMIVVYTINRSPSVRHNVDFLQRVWIGKDVSYWHMRVFGYLTYVHVAKDMILKLDNKSQTCIFVGYYEEQFSYKLWDLIDKKLIESRDMVFMEDKTIVEWEMWKLGSSF